MMERDHRGHRFTTSRGAPAASRATPWRPLPCSILRTSHGSAGLGFIKFGRRKGHTDGFLSLKKRGFECPHIQVDQNSTNGYGIFAGRLHAASDGQCAFRALENVFAQNLVFSATLSIQTTGRSRISVDAPLRMPERHTLPPKQSSRPIQQAEMIGARILEGLAQ